MKKPKSEERSNPLKAPWSDLLGSASSHSREEGSSDLPAKADLLSSDLLSGLDKDEAKLVGLILASQGIEAFREHHDGLYDVTVDDLQLDRAEDILLQYYAENSPVEGETSTTDHLSFPGINQRGKTAAISASLLLCLIHAAAVYHGNHHQVVLDYGASALYILQGEYYRTVTALMLHSDFEHLAGNVVGLLFLGIPLCSIAGAGRGLFLILISGATGNLLNAHLFRKAHLSIGASTAVMGAMGILVLWQMRKRGVTLVRKKARQVREGAHPLERIDIKPSALFPLGAGAALVGMFSGGENTDVSAHVFGFLCGLAAAMLPLFFPTLFRRDFFVENKDGLSEGVDNCFIVIVVAIMLLAWFKF